MAFYSNPFCRVSRRSAHPSSFFPVVPASVFQQDFTAPFFRVFDELESLTNNAAAATAAASSRSAANNNNNNNNQDGETTITSYRSFQPRFDVREDKDAYHLAGELPGIDQQDINIEFTGQNTLVVRGRTVKETTSGTPPQQAEQTIEAAPAAEDAKAVENTTTTTTAAAATEGMDVEEPAEGTRTPASEASSSNYQRPSVAEDEEWNEVSSTTGTAEPVNTKEAATDTAAAEENDAAATTSTTTRAPEQEQQQQQQQQQQQDAEAPRYWVRERSIGEFHRTFRFPAGQVDQDGVTAQLRDGLLSITVPKVQPKQPKKIVVQ